VSPSGRIGGNGVPKGVYSRLLQSLCCMYTLADTFNFQAYADEDDVDRYMVENNLDNQFI